jgi:drug/metabolite transporter (DMT)-like permease
MSPLGILAGLLGATSFGAGDFTGALGARRAGALIVVAGAHAVGFAALLVAALVIRPPLPPLDAAAFGLAAGVAGMVGLAALYRGMALGSMGLVTSISGAGSVALTVVVAAIGGASTTPIQLLGIACAAGASAAAGGASRDEIGRQSLALAGVAAVAFGAWYVLVDAAAVRGDAVWALVLSRATSAGLAAVVVAIRGFDPAVIPVGLVVVAGLFDVGGNALYVVARDLVPLGPAAALIGLYPIVTVLLARILLGERLTRLGQIGVALALAAIVLISIGR